MHEIYLFMFENKNGVVYWDTFNQGNAWRLSKAYFIHAFKNAHLSMYINDYNYIYMYTYNTMASFQTRLNLVIHNNGRQTEI